MLNRGEEIGRRVMKAWIRGRGHTLREDENMHIPTTTKEEAVAHSEYHANVDVFLHTRQCSPDIS